MKIDRIPGYWNDHDPKRFVPDRPINAGPRDRVEIPLTLGRSEAIVYRPRRLRVAALAVLSGIVLLGTPLAAEARWWLPAVVAAVTTAAVVAMR